MASKKRNKTAGNASSASGGSMGGGGSSGKFTFTRNRKSINNVNNNNKPKSSDRRKKSTAEVSASLSKSISKVTRGKSVGRTNSLSSVSSHGYTVGSRFTMVSSLELREMVHQSSGCITQFGESLYDCVVLYIVCPRHKKLALCQVVNKGLFLPFGPVRSGEPWMMAAMRLIQKMLKVQIGEKVSNFHEPIIMDVARIQIPIYFDFITRVVYCIQLTEDACRTHNQCQDNSVIAWFPLDEIYLYQPQSANNYLGPEPVLLRPTQPLQCRESTIFEIVAYSHQNKEWPEGKLLNRTGYKEADILKLYSEYLQHCYPSEYMTLHSFKTFMNRWEFPLKDPTDVFRAFCLEGKNHLNFIELLLGLSAIDQSIMNRNSPDIVIDEFISGYYFRYYSKTSLYIMTEAEVLQLLADLRDSNISSTTKSQVSKLLHNSGRQNGGITKEIFYSLLNLLIKYDSIIPELYRCCVSPLSFIRSRNSYPALQLKQIASSDTNKSAVQTKIQRTKDFCLNCRSKQYTLAVHIVKMSTDGYLHEPIVNNQADVDRMLSHKRILSCRYFTKSFVCNQIIDMIRDYAVRAKIINGPLTLDDRQSAGIDWSTGKVWYQCTEKIIKICQEARKLLENCSTVIKVTSPCYIIGDLHGNLHDLLVYERTIWKVGPYFTPVNYLFLGDYVDRGDYSVEVILYLLCMKLLVPDRIFMLRGNHETRSLQKEFTFYNECLQKFDNRGEEIWNIFNDVFDVMPLCAIIDESIYCAHGGIPSCAQRIEQIMALRTPLKDPDNDSDISLEILWNDPVSNQEYQDLLNHSSNIIINERLSSSTSSHMLFDPDDRSLLHRTPSRNRPPPPDGYLWNTKRGTACYYSEDALSRFLTLNSLTHVVRAHEVIPSGYQYHMGGRCITIFSCSHYCGGINEAAVVFVFDSKIRVIKFDMR